jgi:hypothetical protein
VNVPTTTRFVGPTAREAALEAYFQKRVRLAGGITFKLAPTVKGVPDRLVLLPMGKVFLVELKTAVGQLSAAQKLWHERAAAIGMHVDVVYGREQIDRWILAAQTSQDPRRARGGRKSRAEMDARETVDEIRDELRGLFAQVDDDLGATAIKTATNIALLVDLNFLDD